MPMAGLVIDDGKAFMNSKVPDSFPLMVLTERGCRSYILERN